MGRPGAEAEANEEYFAEAKFPWLSKYSGDSPEGLLPADFPSLFSGEK